MLAAAAAVHAAIAAPAAPDRVSAATTLPQRAATLGRTVNYPLILLELLAAKTIEFAKQTNNNTEKGAFSVS